MFIIVFGRILIMITSIISIRLFTTFLSPAEIGRLNIFLAIYSWFALVLLNPVVMYVNRKIIEWNMIESVHKNLISLFKYFIIVAMSAGFGVVVLNHLIGIGIIASSIWIFIIIAGSILLTSLNVSVLGWLNLFRKRFLFVFFSVLTLWLGLGISIFFILRLFPKAEYWLLGQLLGNALILLLATVTLFRILKKSNAAISDNKEGFTLSAVFNFAWPLAIGTFLYWCHTQGYRFVFQKLVGLDTLGFFVVGFGLGSNLMLSFDTLFNQYYHPIFYSGIANNSDQQKTIAWNKYAHAFFPASIIVAVYVSLGGPLFAKVFTGERFHIVGNIILWGAVSELFRMFASTIGMISHAQMEMKPLILPSITGAATAIISIFLFVRINPFLGGGVSLALGWFFASTHLFFKMKRLLPVQIPWRRIIYSLILSLPLFVFFVAMKNILISPTIFQSVILLGVSALYVFFAQIIMARRWLSLPIKMTMVDDFEQKMKSIVFGDL